jgi:UDP-glucuronate 4-epimerase
MNLLITGAAGFIGSHLVQRLVARGDTVVGIDNFDPFYARALKERNLEGLRQARGFVMLEADLRSQPDLDRAFAAAGGAIDSVVHLAALAGVQPSLRTPERFYDVNVMGTLRLFETARRHGARRLVLASSSSVYGVASPIPFKESDPCGRPASPYAVTKRACELMAFNAHHLAGVAATCLRFFTVYGPRQRPDLAIHKFTRLIAEGQPIELYGDGSTSRDYTWVDDIVDGVVAAIDQQGTDPSPRYRIYNLGGSKAVSLARLVELIAGALGTAATIVRKPEQPGDMQHTHADVTLAGRELGYAPRVSIDEGIPRFVDWWRESAR